MHTKSLSTLSSVSALAACLLAVVCSNADSAILGVNSGTPSIIEIDEMSGAQQQYLPVIGGGLRFVADAGESIVAKPGAGSSALFFDSTTGAFQREIMLPVQGVVTGLAYGSSLFGDTVFVAAGAPGDIQLVDPSNGALFTSLPGLGFPVRALEYDPYAGDLLAISGTFGMELFRIDVATGAITEQAGLPGRFRGLAVTEPFDPLIGRGSLVGLADSGELVGLDSFGGISGPIVGPLAPPVADISGFKPIPEPSVAWFVSASIAAVCLRRRR